MLLEKRNVKILLFEDFINNKQNFIGDLSAFLGTDMEFENERILKKNASTSNFFTKMHMYANKFSERDPTKSESQLYYGMRKAVNKLDTISSQNAFANQISHYYACY